jgi:hypothetical protein
LRDGGAFDDDAGQTSGREHSDEYIDPVRRRSGTLTGVAVDDESFERLFVGEELLADPEQIFFCLFMDGNARPNASVDKQKIAAADPDAYSKIELDWCGLLDIRYAPIATKFCIAAKTTRCANARNRCAIARCAGSPTASAVTGGKIVKT